MHSLLHSSELRPVAPVRVLVVLHQNHFFVKSDVFLQRSLFYGQRFEIFLVTSEFRSLFCGKRNVATQHVLGTLTYAVDEFLVALLYVLSLSSVCRPITVHSHVLLFPSHIHVLCLAGKDIRFQSVPIINQEIAIRTER